MHVIEKVGNSAFIQSKSTKLHINTETQYSPAGRTLSHTIMHTGRKVSLTHEHTINCQQGLTGRTHTHTHYCPAGRTDSNCGAGAIFAVPSKGLSGPETLVPLVPLEPAALKDGHALDLDRLTDFLPEPEAGALLTISNLKCFIKRIRMDGKAHAAELTTESRPNMTVCRPGVPGMIPIAKRVGIVEKTAEMTQRVTVMRMMVMVRLSKACALSLRVTLRSRANIVVV